MDSFILGVKKEQSQTFDSKGNRIPTTFIQTSPNILLGIKSKETDGYTAAIIGFKEARTMQKPVFGKLKKIGVEKKLQFIQEFRLHSDNIVFEEKKPSAITLQVATIKIGEEIKPSHTFKEKDKVSVTSISKGKGFQGVVKRHGFKGGPKTHGQSDRQRAPGSIGMTTTPGRVFKGKRMAGRMGNDTVSIGNLTVVEIKDTGLVVKGLIPGSIGSLVRVQNYI